MEATAPRPAAPPTPAPRQGGGRGWIGCLAVGVLALCACACFGGGLSAIIATGNWPSGVDVPIVSPGTRVEGPRTGRDGMAEIPIAAGPFIMGADDGDPDEAPRRTVEQPAFYFDRNKVSVEQFGRWARNNSVAGDWSRDADPKSPVVGVTFDDASRYCRAQGRRLPTEAEWEKAARGTDGRIYPWGNNWDWERVDFGSFKFSSYPIASYSKTWGPVGAKGNGASVYGVLDVAGGPREWVADWYGPYPGAPALGFTVPPETLRVTRGGFRINNYSRDVRTTARGWQAPNEASPDLGFRCAE
jgi:formylglycine-generating enzyme required for sulfatase activity